MGIMSSYLTNGKIMHYFHMTAEQHFDFRAFRWHKMRAAFLAGIGFFWSVTLGFLLATGSLKEAAAQSKPPASGLEFTRRPGLGIETELVAASDGRDFLTAFGRATRLDPITGGVVVELSCQVIDHDGNANTNVLGIRNSIPGR